MYSYDEINVIITELLNSLTEGNTKDHKFSDLIRFLGKARSKLRGASDKGGHNAKRVITALARVQRWIVKYTVLWQEQEMQTAIELPTEKINNADHLSNYPDGYSS